MKLRIVIFDDNSQRRDAMSLLINSMDTMECVGAFVDCSHVINDITAAKPDVVLMDIDMPNVNGIEGVQKIRNKFPTIKILMQTVFEDDEKVFASVCAGADGYILKQTNPMRLIDAISEVMEGGAPMSPTVARKVLQLFNKQYQKQDISDFNLTRREIDILELLVKGYSYKMIAKDCNISYSTVNTHITNIYSKLQVESVGGAVTKALKMGIVK